MAEELEPIRHALHVASSPEVAFEVFTARMGDWWDPRYTGDPDAYAGVDIDPRVGGRVLFVYREQPPQPWGTVTAWDPPHAYQQSFWLAHDAAHPSELRITFTAAPDGGCDVAFEHGGWNERNGESRAKFGDWPTLLDGFVRVANGQLSNGAT